jgi:Rrf2 family protein
MQITRQADYAVRAVMHLARLETGGRAPTSLIAREQKIPPSFLAKIVSQLSVAGVVQTSRGARGGVALARQPEEVTLLEVVEAIDGPIMLNECVNGSNSCPFGDNCVAHEVWCEAQADLVRKLDETHFKQLASKNQSKS